MGAQHPVHPSQQVPAYDWLQEALVSQSLVPDWQEQPAESVQISPLGGASRCSFKATCSNKEGTYCVRLLREGKDERLPATARRLAASGLTPQVVGVADASRHSMPAGTQGILVQRWIQGSAPTSFTWREQQNLERLASFVARLHRQPLDGAAEAPKARPEDLRTFAASMLKGPVAQHFVPGVLAEIAELEQLAAALPQQRELVLTHGDLHSGNLLDGTELSDGPAQSREARLWAIDLELVGPRPCETDLSYLFIHLGLNHMMKAYPSANSRRRFAETYLRAKGSACDAPAVEGLLFRVEQEWPFQALWVAIASLSIYGDASMASFTLSVLPQVRNTLRAAASDASIRSSIVESGVAAAATAPHWAPGGIPRISAGPAMPRAAGAYGAGAVPTMFPPAWQAQPSW
eukprot:TRINITY_DN79085_c0_g1_i1.p1 TRINITY_DN79085_c0_g1~~TRINITY_DN79085_c0_g1_i1.p1  ORF type:complete len:426 (+),score=83.75 TRINITY_DN79085_c0_g1_i1:66-1280(+)